LRPLVIVEGVELAEVVNEFRGRGWRTVHGWDPGGSEWDVSPLRLLCWGVICQSEEAAASIMAAVRGTGIIATLEVEPSIRVRFLEDLHHLGPVDSREGREPQGLILEVDQIRLLDLLTDGLSLPDAARRLYLSPRTVERRLAAARQALGVPTTAEALVAYARHGGRTQR